MEELRDLDDSALARLERIGGPTLRGKIIELFLLHTPNVLETAMRAQREGNTAGVTRAMHSLKSSAGNVGAQTMRHLAETLERQAHVEGREWIDNRLAKLTAAYERVRPLLLQRKEAVPI